MSCKKDNPVIVEYDGTPYNLEFNTNSLPEPNLPLDNPLTVEKIALGRMLFFDPLLSQDGTISCSSCHIQEDGFSDSRQFSEGVGGLTGNRQAMAIFNLAWHENGFFWDGRAELLRHQAVLPIQDPVEMNESLAMVISKLQFKKAYQDQFKRAFANGKISANNIALALEAFMFSIISDNSKYDQFLAGNATLTESEERGRFLFFEEFNEFFPDESGAGCAHCHAGSNFENDEYMNNGLDAEGSFTDLGREDVTGDLADRARFKVPSLRNVAVTAPYMHDGRFNTLEETIEHYNSGLQESSTLEPHLVATLPSLMLDEDDITDLINFLNTLTDETYLNNPDYKSPFE